MKLREYPRAIAGLEVELLALDWDVKPYKKEIKMRLDYAERDAAEGRNDSQRKILRDDALRANDGCCAVFARADYRDLVDYVDLIAFERQKITIQLTLLRSEFKVALSEFDAAVADGDRTSEQIDSSLEHLRLELEKIETQTRRDAITQKVEAKPDVKRCEPSKLADWTNW